MNKGAKLISEAIIGVAIKAVVVNGKRYTITSPTIHKIAGAAMHLSNITLKDKDSSIKDVLESLGNIKELSAALSWFINDDESLTDELSKGTIGEVVSGIESAYQMIDMRDFTRAVGISKCVAELTAKPK